MRIQNPENLYFLFAIAIPILIHLLNLRKHKTIYFSSIRFLKNIKEHHHQKSKLKNILLLISRILALSFLIIAFCKPHIPSDDSTNTKNVFIYIDNSQSMDIDFGKGNLLNKAKEKAKKISESYPKEQVFYLITNDFFAINNNSYDMKLLSNQIDKITSTPKTKSINDILSKINSLGSNNHLYFISDMQTNSAKISELQEDSNKISLIRLENKILPNLSIDSCFISSPIFISENEIKINVKISNNGNKDITDEVIFLNIDNKQKSQQYINLEAGNVKEIFFRFLTENKDIINGEFKLNDSHITYDNRLFFTLNKSKKIKTCMIYDDSNNKSFNHLFQEDTLLFEYTEFDITNINYNILLEQNFIILDGVENLNSGLVSSLNNFVDNGNTLLIIPPKKINKISRYNQKLKSLRVNSISGEIKSQFKINKFDFDHPLYKNVFSEEIKLIDYPSSFKSFKINNNISNTKIIKLENNNTFLTSYNKNNGFVFQFSSPLDSLHNNFTQHALFVPTLINIAISSIQIDAPYYTLKSNQNIKYKNKNINKADIRIKGYDLDFIPTIKGSSGNYTINVHNQINNHGIYNLEKNNEILNKIAFNYCRTESNLSSLSISELKRILKNNENVDILSSENNKLISNIKEKQLGKELWKIAIMLSLLFFAIEILIIKTIKI